MCKILFKINLILTCCLAATVTYAATVATPIENNPDSTQHQAVKNFLQQIVDVNLRYKDKFHTVITQAMLNQQTPEATLVLCSDSRVDSDIVSDSPTGELFVIRNIGNQVDTAFGSVEYGVDDLKTSVLLIVGHSQCGAIKAAMGDYSTLPIAIRKELTTLEVNRKATLNQNIVHNVNNQVKQAMITFANQVKQGKLTIIGMIYDMHNDFRFGNGQLILININNETSQASLAQHHYIQGIEHLVILGSN